MWDLYKGKVYEKLAKMHKKNIFYTGIDTNKQGCYIENSL